MIQVGKIFAGRYKVIKQIGRGGMADVYLARDLILDGQEIAIKVLRTNYQTDPIAVARFQREARAMSDLDHPNIVGVTDIGEEEGQQYLAMEYVNGVDLKKYIQQNSPLTNEDVVRIMGQILLGMRLAHMSGIVHRDLKPQNVLLTDKGDAKVTDFGIAVAFAETSLTQTNSMLGSVHYLSPEQARGAKATVQSDIYAMGIMLYEMLTGHIPYDGDSAVTIALKHFQQPLPSIGEDNPNVPQALENVVIKATAKKLSDRYQTVEEMYADLNSSLSSARKKEKKLVFKDNKVDTKTLPKTPQSTREISHHHSEIEPVEVATPLSSGKKWPKFSQLRLRYKAILGAVLLLVLAFLAILLTSPKSKQVPDVSGQTLETAMATLKKSGFVLGSVSEESSSEMKIGDVIRTKPKPGVTRREGATIDVVISAGVIEFAMEDFIGKSYQEALDTLKLTYNVSEKLIKINEMPVDESYGYAAGEVISQTPRAGENYKVADKQEIVFNVAKIPETIEMPDFGNFIYTYADARNYLINLGVPSEKIEKLEDLSYTTAHADWVTNQSPAAGAVLDLSSDTVSLYVSVATETATAPTYTSSFTIEVPTTTYTDNVTTPTVASSWVAETTPVVTTDTELTDTTASLPASSFLTSETTTTSD